MKIRFSWIITLVVIITFALVNCGDNENIITYTVTFDSKGGSPVAQINNVKSGSKISAPSNPNKENCSFDGWYKEETLSNVWNFSTDTITANIILYAKWEEHKEHSGTITAFGNTINIKGDVSISASDFVTVKTKLESAMVLANSWYTAGDIMLGKYATMLERNGFTILIETGNNSPNVNTDKSMTIGVGYLLDTTEYKIAVAIDMKVDSNAFAN